MIFNIFMWSHWPDINRIITLNRWFLLSNFFWFFTSKTKFVVCFGTSLLYIADKCRFHVRSVEEWRLLDSNFKSWEEFWVVIKYVKPTDYFFDLNAIKCCCWYAYFFSSNLIYVFPLPYQINDVTSLRRPEI